MKLGSKLVKTNKIQNDLVFSDSLFSDKQTTVKEPELIGFVINLEREQNFLD